MRLLIERELAALRTPAESGGDPGAVEAPPETGGGALGRVE